MTSQMKALDEYILMMFRGFVLLLKRLFSGIENSRCEALDEYILMVLFVFLLERVHFLFLSKSNEILRMNHSKESSWWVHSNGSVSLFTGEFFFFFFLSQTKSWGLTTQKKTLDEYILMAVLSLKRVPAFCCHETWRFCLCYYWRELV